MTKFSNFLLKQSNIIELFKSNSLLFQNTVDELIDIETITSSKETNTSYTIIVRRYLWILIMILATIQIVLNLWKI